jgi:hypothetical protein
MNAAEQLALRTPLRLEDAVELVRLARSAGYSDEQLDELVTHLARTYQRPGRLAYEAYAWIMAARPPKE